MPSSVGPWAGEEWGACEHDTSTARSGSDPRMIMVRSSPNTTPADEWNSRSPGVRLTPGRRRASYSSWSTPGGTCYNLRWSIGEEPMLHLAALASLLVAAAVQDKAKPADGEETVAAQKGNLTPVFELEAFY